MNLGSFTVVCKSVTSSTSLGSSDPKSYWWCLHISGAADSSLHHKLSIGLIGGHTIGKLLYIHTTLQCFVIYLLLLYTGGAGSMLPTGNNTRFHCVEYLGSIQTVFEGYAVYHANNFFRGSQGNSQEIGRIRRILSKYNFGQSAVLTLGAYLT